MLLFRAISLFVLSSPIVASVFVPRQNVSIMPPNLAQISTPSPINTTTAAAVVASAIAKNIDSVVASALIPLANNRSQTNATTTTAATTIDDTEDLELGNEELRLTEKQLENNIFDSMQNLHKLEDRLNRQMKDLERRLNLAAEIIRKRTNESHSMSIKILKGMSDHVINLDTRSDRFQQLLSNTSSIYYDNVRELLNNVTEKLKTEIRQTFESRVQIVEEKILERVNATRFVVEKKLNDVTAKKCTAATPDSIHFPDTRTATDESGNNDRNVSVKANRDIDLLSNLDLQIMTKIDLTGKSKLVSLTPLMLAKRMRDMMNELWNRQGMVSVCYHNKPRAFTTDHPLAPNDPDYVRLFFNGTMDAVHAPDKGINLNVPNYINALILELKNTNRDHVSLCIEANAADSKHENWAKCLNMIVKKKN